MNELLWRALCAEMAKETCPVPNEAQFQFGVAVYRWLAEDGGRLELIVYSDLSVSARGVSAGGVRISREITTAAELIALLEWVTVTEPPGGEA